MSETPQQTQNHSVVQEAEAAIAAAQASANPDIITAGQSSLHPNATAESVYLPGGGALIADVDNASGQVIGIETHAAERRQGGRFSYHTKVNTLPEAGNEAVVEYNGRKKHFTGEQAERIGAAAVRRLAQRIKATE